MPIASGIGGMVRAEMCTGLQVYSVSMLVAMEDGAGLGEYRCI